MGPYRKSGMGPFLLGAIESEIIKPTGGNESAYAIACK